MSFQSKSLFEYYWLLPLSKPSAGCPRLGYRTSPPPILWAGVFLSSFRTKKTAHSEPLLGSL